MFTIVTRVLLDKTRLLLYYRKRYAKLHRQNKGLSTILIVSVVLMGKAPDTLGCLLFLA